MAKKIKQIVISKDEAVFWLDKQGRWNNEHGPFQHKKIIDFFHLSIRKDKDGFYLVQTDGNYKEKVYFRYKETALFVFDVMKGEEIVLILNTKQKIKLKPKKLSIKNDDLYMDFGKEIVKFTQESLFKISDLIECVNDQYFIKVNGRRYKIHKL